MDINRSNMDALFKGFNILFRDAYKSAPAVQWQTVAMTVPSTTSANVYPFLEQFGGMREWIGDRQMKNLSSKKIEVVNRDFEDSVSVKRNDILDDQYGMYNNYVAELGDTAARLWQELVVEALTADAEWIDGKAFFAADRKYGKNVIANKSTEALTAATFAAAYKTMMGYVGHAGKTLGVVPDTLIVGPALRETAWNILKNDFTYNADKVQIRNPNQNLCEPIVMHELVGTAANYWFLAQTKRPLKPVAIQQRELPQLTAVTSPESDNVFNRNEYKYGTNARGAAFLTIPHLIYAGIV